VKNQLKFRYIEFEVRVINIQLKEFILIFKIIIKKVYRKTIDLPERLTTVSIYTK